ncbi:hypothetical protein EOD41_15180 [Mucilaginibacter limnophilus]|uniref:Lipocalin-like domain-containing protein n=1 Tax=Mucilaginibacter limnophilus TaxID=1932778 RepID=A0A3S2VL62_9SPHI|nr:hypothetical protein [Mucilaginibacter limnophilus]RVT99783.1 hypothetical protein EOD41_15180 [Mucilaginibacter limnophilus]
MRYKAFLAMMVICLLAACSKRTVQPVTILGKWQMKSYTQKIFKDDALISSIALGDGNFTTADYIIFNADGTGGASTSRPELDYFKSNFNFVYDDPTITLIQYQNGGNTTVTTKYTIDSISTTSLTVYTSANYIVEGVEYVKNETIVFVKI